MANQPARQLHLFPSHVERFLQCPQWYRYQYEDRLNGDDNVRPLLRGIALHEVLADDARRLMQGLPLLDNVPAAVARALPVTKYPAALKPAWKEDVDQVVQGVTWARERLREIAGSGEILAIEKILPYRLHGKRRHIVLRAKVDLVVRHHDGTLEVVDYKSGKSVKEQPIQQLLSRIVTGAEFSNHERVIMTTVHTAVQQVTSRELTKADSIDTWKTIIVAADAIQGGEREPIPSALCDWCPYFDRCPAHAERGATDELTAFLEEVADAADDEQPAA